MQNYEPLEDGNEHGDHAMLIHVVAPSPVKTWNHVGNLDKFFTRVYKYHQRQGFRCIAIAEVCELINFIFVICLTIYVFNCISFDLLFSPPPPPHAKITIEDVLEDPITCIGNLCCYIWIVFGLAFLILLILLFRRAYVLYRFWDIKEFYNIALGVPDSELVNLTWHEIQLKVRQAQVSQRIVVHSKQLTDLDIYQRILRVDNYFVAMANKKLLPPRLQVPFVGEIVYWTPALRFIMERILFLSPWAPFEEQWKLSDVYKLSSNRKELAEKLRGLIYRVALLCVLLSPLIFVWQILHTFFTYAEMIKREPGFLSVRRWSLYGRLYLRHFNELEHELNTRLNRAHRPSTRYLSSFSSPIVSVLARNAAFMIGSIASIVIVLTLIDGDILSFERGFFYMALLGFGIAVCRSLIPDETLAWCPETLLASVVECIHYLPPGWQGQAHTTRVRKEFEQLFQLSSSAILENLLSPILTPYILWKHVAPRSLDIIDFLRHFTIEVEGIGDVCSFALMDIRKHGNPDWHNPREEKINPVVQCDQGEDGKTELSLIHFATTNPTWVPPNHDEQIFVQVVSPEHSMIQNEAGPSMPQPSNIFGPIPSSSAYVPQNVSSISPPSLGMQSSCDLMLKVNLLDSMHCSRNRLEGPSTYSAKSMSYSALLLHDCRYKRGRTRHETPAKENTPLLFNH